MTEKKEKDTIYTALANLHNQLKNPKKTKTVTVKHKDSNSQHQFKYAPLDAIMEYLRPLLRENGLFIIQYVKGVGTEREMVTKVVHVTGEFLESSIPFPAVPSSIKDYGSMLTYTKRYGLCTGLFISAEDDVDGAQHKAKFTKVHVKQQLHNYGTEMGECETTDDLKELQKSYRDFIETAKIHYPELVFGEGDGINLAERFSMLWTEFTKIEVAAKNGNKELDHQYKNTVGA